MMRVITKALNKLNKKKKEMMAIYLDATALVYCMSLSTIGSTPIREGLNSREYIKELGSVAERCFLKRNEEADELKKRLRK